MTRPGDYFYYRPMKYQMFCLNYPRLSSYGLNVPAMQWCLTPQRIGVASHERSRLEVEDWRSHRTSSFSIRSYRPKDGGSFFGSRVPPRHTSCRVGRVEYAVKKPSSRIRTALDRF